MSKVRSARGEVVDFQLLTIKQKLASAPAPASVEQRRRFIDEKDGVRTTKVVATEVASDALSLGLAAAEESATAAPKKTK